MSVPSDHEQPSAIDAILAERESQVARWGNEFDDTHGQNDWVAFITAYAGKGFASDPHGEKYPTGDAFVSAMVKVGALAVAALEAYARHQHGQEPIDA